MLLLPGILLTRAQVSQAGMMFLQKAIHCQSPFLGESEACSEIMRTGSSDGPKLRNICLACLFHLCNWVFPLLSIRAFFSSFCPSVSPLAEQRMRVWMADNKDSPMGAGVGQCTEGGFYRIMGALRKTLQLLCWEGELGVCQR